MKIKREQNNTVKNVILSSMVKMEKEEVMVMVCLIIIGNGCVSYSYKHAFLRGFDR